MRKDEIIEYVNKGYLVRSQTDIETYEAKVNDKKRAVAAFESGAEVLSEDFLSLEMFTGLIIILHCPETSPSWLIQ